jgi:hypothetical protein
MDKTLARIIPDCEIIEKHPTTDGAAFMVRKQGRCAVFIVNGHTVLAPNWDAGQGTIVAPLRKSSIQDFLQWTSPENARVRLRSMIEPGSPDNVFVLDDFRTEPLRPV